jgi:hypothetical protein
LLVRTQHVSPQMKQRQNPRMTKLPDDKETLVFLLAQSPAKAPKISQQYKIRSSEKGSSSSNQTNSTRAMNLGSIHKTLTRA